MTGPYVFVDTGIDFEDIPSQSLECLIHLADLRTAEVIAVQLNRECGGPKDVGVDFWQVFYAKNAFQLTLEETAAVSGLPADWTAEKGSCGPLAYQRYRANHLADAVQKLETDAASLPEESHPIRCLARRLLHLVEELANHQNNLDRCLSWRQKTRTLYFVNRELVFAPGPHEETWRKWKRDLDAERFRLRALTGIAIRASRGRGQELLWGMRDAGQHETALVANLNELTKLLSMTTTCGGYSWIDFDLNVRDFARLIGPMIQLFEQVGHELRAVALPPTSVSDTRSPESPGLSNGTTSVPRSLPTHAPVEQTVPDGQNKSDLAEKICEEILEPLIDALRHLSRYYDEEALRAVNAFVEHGVEPVNRADRVAEWLEFNTSAACVATFRSYIGYIDQYCGVYFTRERKQDPAYTVDPTNPRDKERGFSQEASYDMDLAMRVAEEVADYLERLAAMMRARNDNRRSFIGGLEHPPPPPLSKLEQQVLEEIKSLPEGEGITGRQILDRLARGGGGRVVEQGTLTRHIMPMLKQWHGVKNRRGVGYYIGST